MYLIKITLSLFIIFCAGFFDVQAGLVALDLHAAGHIAFFKNMPLPALRKSHHQATI